MRKIQRIVALAAAVLLVGSSVATVIAHGQQPDFVSILSDLHYSSAQRADGAQTQGRLLSRAGDLLDAALAKAAGNVLILAGDLTENGTQQEHDYVATKLRAYRAANPDTQIFVIPGEQDILSIESPSAITKRQFAEVYREFGYASGYDDDLNYTRDLTLNGEICRFIFMNTVGEDGRPCLTSPAYIQAQTEAAAKYNVPVVGVAHHPSISRGSPETRAIHFLETAASVKNAAGEPVYTGDLLSGLDLQDHSAFPEEDMGMLADAGMHYLISGHSHESSVKMGESLSGAQWKDYGAGSLVTAGASVSEMLVYQNGVDFYRQVIDTLPDGANVLNLARAAMTDYLPVRVGEIRQQMEPVLVRALEVWNVILQASVDAWDISEIVPATLEGLVRGPFKDLVNRIIWDIKAPDALHDVIMELTDAFMNSTIPEPTGVLHPMKEALVDAILAKQKSGSVSATSLGRLLSELGQGKSDGLAAGALRSFAQELGKDCDSVVGMLNKLLAETLQIGTKSPCRALLLGPVKFVAGLFTVNLWDIFDKNYCVKPDGTPIEPEYKPSVIYKPLVERILLMPDAPASTELTAERLISGLQEKSSELIEGILLGSMYRFPSALSP